MRNLLILFLALLPLVGFSQVRLWQIIPSDSAQYIGSDYDSIRGYNVRYPWDNLITTDSSGFQYYIERDSLLGNITGVPSVDTIFVVNGPDTLYVVDTTSSGDTINIDTIVINSIDTLYINEGNPFLRYRHIAVGDENDLISWDPEEFRYFDDQDRLRIDRRNNQRTPGLQVLGGNTAAPQIAISSRSDSSNATKASNIVGYARNGNYLPLITGIGFGNGNNVYFGIDWGTVGGKSYEPIDIFHWYTGDNLTMRLDEVGNLWLHSYPAKATSSNYTALLGYNSSGQVVPIDTAGFGGSSLSIDTLWYLSGDNVTFTAVELGDSVVILGQTDTMTSSETGLVFEFSHENDPNSPHQFTKRLVADADSGYLFGINTYAGPTLDAKVGLDIKNQTLRTPAGSDYLIFYDVTADTNYATIIDSLPISGGGGGGNPPDTAIHAFDLQLTSNRTLFGDNKTLTFDSTATFTVTADGASTTDIDLRAADRVRTQSDINGTPNIWDFMNNGWFEITNPSDNFIVHFTDDSDRLTSAGLNNVFIGNLNVAGRTIGNWNVILGEQNGTGLTGGNTNVIIGRGNASSLTNQNNNVIIGNFANAGGAANVVIGSAAGGAGTGADNVYIGSATGSATGQGNVLLGREAATGNNAVGANNLVWGWRGYGSSTGSDNIVLGQFAGDGSLGSNNIALGQYSLNNATTSNSVAIGRDALRSIVSDNATAIGYQIGSFIDTFLTFNAQGYKAAREYSDDEPVDALFFGSNAGETGFGKNPFIMGNNSWDGGATTNAGASTNINLSTDKFYYPAHGFTVGGGIVMWFEGSVAPGGTGGLGTRSSWEITDADSVQYNGDITSQGTATLRHYDKYDYVTIIGHNIEPTADSTLYLGNSNTLYSKFGPKAIQIDDVTKVPSSSADELPQYPVGTIMFKADTMYRKVSGTNPFWKREVFESW